MVSVDNFDIDTEPPMGEVVARYRWTVDELVAARRWHYLHTTRPFFRGAIWVLSVLFFVTGIGVLASGEVAAGAMMSGFACLIAFGLTIGTPWLSRLQFRKRTDQNAEIEWQV